jgi:hypothetical protein
MHLFELPVKGTELHYMMSGLFPSPYFSFSESAHFSLYVFVCWLQLLQKDPSRRLGSAPNGSEDLKQQKWFKVINWRKLEARQVTPKFLPAVNGKQCTANFDEMWTKLPTDDSPASTPKSVDDDFFRGYTYVAPNTWLA